MVVRGWNIAAMARLALIGVTIGLAGCSHNWSPNPGTDFGTFGQTKARCSYLARHGGGDFAAVGSPQFVAAAALGSAIGDAVRQTQDFDDCMAASGWHINDNPTPQTASLPQTGAVPLSGSVLTGNVLSSDGRITAMLPNGWAKSPPPTGSRYTIFSINKEIDAGFGAWAYSRQDIADPRAYAAESLRLQIAQHPGSTGSDIKEITVNGHDTYIYEVTSPINGLNVSFLDTVIVMDSVVVRCVGWTNKSDFDHKKLALLQIMYTVTQTSQLP